VLLYLDALRAKGISNNEAVFVEASDYLEAVLREIPEVKCAKSSAHEFAERMEDVVRLLVQDGGLLSMVTGDNIGQVRVHLKALAQKAKQASSFLDMHSEPGWLKRLMKASTSGKGYSSSTSSFFSFWTRSSRPVSFQSLDDDITGIVNTIVRVLVSPHVQHLALFTRKQYETMDVKRSIGALGGVDTISLDVAKQRALARLIGSDYEHVSSELSLLVAPSSAFDVDSRQGRNSFASSGGGGSRCNSSSSSRDGRDDGAGGRSCVHFFSCCCAFYRTGFGGFGGDDTESNRKGYSTAANPSHASSHGLWKRIDMDEPLV